MHIKNYKDIFFHGYIITFIVLLILALGFDIFVENYFDIILESITLVLLISFYFLWKNTHLQNLFALLLVWLSVFFVYIIVFFYDFKYDTPFYIIFVSFAFFYLLDKKTLKINIVLYAILSFSLMIWGYFTSDNRLFFDSLNSLMAWTTLFIFVLAIAIFNYLSLAYSFKNLEDANIQKDILLQEVHHRVKNNLNMMSSMIGLHETKNNPHLETFVEDYRHRINAIGLIHELLYASNDYKHISFQMYIEKLAHYLLSSCANSNASFHIDSSNITFSLEKITSLGLILQELISNTLKYADNGNPYIKIHIYLKNNEYILIYSDNGARNKQETKNKSMGMNLINIKMKELKGNINIEKKENTLDSTQHSKKYYEYIYTMRFPHER